jgi:hypothetical protein
MLHNPTARSIIYILNYLLLRLLIIINKYMDIGTFQFIRIVPRVGG